MSRKMCIIIGITLLKSDMEIWKRIMSSWVLERKGKHDFGTYLGWLNGVFLIIFFRYFIYHYPEKSNPAYRHDPSWVW